jgi:hypothetical protein
VGQENRPEATISWRAADWPPAFGHREHHLAPYLKLGDAWSDDLDGGSQPDVEDAPGRLNAFDLSTGLEMQQAINQRRGIADLAPCGRGGFFDHLTRPLVERQTTALSADQSVQPTDRGQLPLSNIGVPRRPELSGRGT